MKKILIHLWLLSLSLIIVLSFWYNEWKYNLPTPMPSSYQPVYLGEEINMLQTASLNAEKPLVLHFFNPDCPCSRFNIPHFKSLVKQFGSKVNFAIVPMSRKNLTAGEVQEKFGINIPILLDSTLARAYGVYSTPQAVILDSQHKLFYRGNYNKSRYCSNKKTEYARIALEALITDNIKIVFEPASLKAYGCSLPICKK